MRILVSFASRWRGLSVSKGLVRYEEKVLRTKQQSLVRLARQLGRELIPTPDEIAATS